MSNPITPTPTPESQPHPVELDGGTLTRSRLETRILEMPVDGQTFPLVVQSGQTNAVAKMVRVFENFRESNIPDGDDRARSRAYGHLGSDIIVRLHVERYTKTGRVTQNGDFSFDLQGLRPFLNSTSEDRRERWYSLPRAMRAFDDETLARLVRLNDLALAAYRNVDWESIAMQKVAN